MNTNEIARVATLVGEPARTAMLLALLDGRAFTAHELAEVGGVTPQTASAHLSRLVEARLLSVIQQGRHRYHRLASTEVAAMLEGIMQVAAQGRTNAYPIRTGPRDPDMRRVRLCYDHLGGRLAVAITDHLVKQGAVILSQGSGQVTDRLHETLAPLGLAIDLPSDANVLCRPCLDWSERRYHLAGPLGKHICHQLIHTGCLRRKKGLRTLTITAKGASMLNRWIGTERWGTLKEGSTV